jgi:hypothetical protein
MALACIIELVYYTNDKTYLANSRPKATRPKDVREEQEHAVLNLTGLHLFQVCLSLLGGSVKSCRWCSVDTQYILIP